VHVHAVHSFRGSWENFNDPSGALFRLNATSNIGEGNKSASETQDVWRCGFSLAPFYDRLPERYDVIFNVLQIVRLW
jgi:hypothetical protein